MKLAESYVVDLDNKTSTCRLWKLNGCGCLHSVATILYINNNVALYVDPMYFVAFYIDNHNYPLHGTNGSNMWLGSDYIPSLLPLK